MKITSLRLKAAIPLIASIAVIISATTVHAVMYAPGATLAPACGPTDPDCGVASSASQVAEGTPNSILRSSFFTPGTPPFQIEANSYVNTGGGSGTYNHATFTGYNVGRHSGGSVVNGKSALVMGMENDFFDVNDSSHGMEWYVEYFKPDGSTYTRPFYARYLNSDLNNDQSIVITSDIGTGPNGQYTFLRGTTHMIDVLPAGVNVNVPMSIVGKTLSLTGNGSVNMSGTGSSNLSIAVNSLGPVLANAWGNSSNPGILVGTTRTDGAAFQVVNGVGLDANGYPNSSGTTKFYVGGNGNVGIGTASPAYALDVSGDANVASGSSYRYNGIGVMNAQTALANYFFGNSGNLSMTGLYNTSVGNQALSSNTTAGNNSAFGAQSLWKNTTGINNTALGMSALTQNISGEGNVAVGIIALRDNTTGKNNTSVGTETMTTSNGDYNTAVGMHSLLWNTSGYNNTGVGAGALTANSTGAYNTGMGMHAGGANTVGVYNTYLGYHSGFGDTSNVNEQGQIDSGMVLVGTYATRHSSIPQASQLIESVAIGYNAKVLASHQVVLGNDATTTTLLKGNVGIGTTSPGAALDINSTTMVLRQSYVPSTSSTACTTGTMSWGADYVYVCTSTNTWKRASLSSF